MIEVDLGMGRVSRLAVVPGSIVVLDNLDDVAGPAIEPLLARVSAAGAAGLIVTGGGRLRTLLGHSGALGEVKFRLYPLSVLLDGEMRRLIGRDKSPSLAAWTGNHPYLTKLLLHYTDHGGDDAVAAGRCQWEPFVQRLAAEMARAPRGG